jgi:tripartite-type tricarboxylate transporter receptor subunit TctC
VTNSTYKVLLGVHIAVWVSVLSIADSLAQQPAYPAKPIRLIVPFPPGGTTDIVARLLSQAMGKDLGAAVIVDNRGGANGVIGAELAARAPADGYNAFMTSASILAITPHLRNDLGYSVGDFAPVSLLVITPNVLVVHPSVPVRTVKALIVLARARPDAISFGSSGVASIGHIVVEQIRTVAGAPMIHVPYKGAAPAEADLFAGHVAVMATGLVSAMPHVKSGRLRAIAVTTGKRVSAIPDLPTIAETVPGVDTGSWFGILLPTGTPATAIQRISASAASSVRSLELRERLATEGAEVIGSSPSEFAAFIKSESERYGTILKRSGIRLRN